MKITSPASLVAAILLTSAAYAQNSGSVVSPLPGVAVPTTPAPVLAPAATARAAPNQIVYTPRLPTASELTNAAAAQGLAVERIEQSATQIVAVYKTASGTSNTVSYQTLPPTGALVAPPTSPPPTVLYAPAPRVVYYDDYDPFYYPRVWYPSVGVRFGGGFGFRGGFHGGFHHRR